MILRILLIALLFYFIYRLIKNLFLPTNKEKSGIKGNPNKQKPRPYDKNNVEDIDYEDL